MSNKCNCNCNYSNIDCLNRHILNEFTLSSSELPVTFKESSKLLNFRESHFFYFKIDKYFNLPNSKSTSIIIGKTLLVITISIQNNHEKSTTKMTENNEYEMHKTQFTNNKKINLVNNLNSSDSITSFNAQILDDSSKNLHEQKQLIKSNISKNHANLEVLKTIDEKNESQLFTVFSIKTNSSVDDSIIKESSYDPNSLTLNNTTVNSNIRIQVYNYNEKLNKSIKKHSKALNEKAFVLNNEYLYNSTENNLITIGRKDCDILISNKTVSRTHLLLQYNSYNNTWTLNPDISNYLSNMYMMYGSSTVRFFWLKIESNFIIDRNISCFIGEKVYEIEISKTLNKFNM